MCLWSIALLCSQRWLSHESEIWHCCTYQLKSTRNLIILALLKIYIVFYCTWNGRFHECEKAFKIYRSHYLRSGNNEIKVAYTDIDFPWVAWSITKSGISRFYCKKWLRTVVLVSKVIGKNPPAVRQHGRVDFIIIMFISFRIILPDLFIGNIIHHPEYDAMPMFELSSIKPWQMYVKKTMLRKLPIMWKRKIKRVPAGTSACKTTPMWGIILRDFDLEF